ncbi:MAG: glycoside hydrolase family 3 C-terminal domain-containing protein [Chitinispirillaceae bacterium]|nr:glycoside hydrolase family 3 C-terminal domain-containing protein [Chitinispirillaceae bacterium]
MRLPALVCILLAASLNTFVTAQEITGRVVDKQSNPVANASLSLKGKGTTTTSGADGTFSINTTAVQSTGSTSSFRRSLQINGKDLVFYSEIPQQLRVELFDMTGKRVGPLFNQHFQEGSYSLPLRTLLTGRSAGGIYIIRITAGSEVFTLKFSPLGSLRTTGVTATPSAGRLAKRSATPDTLTIAKAGYIPVTKALDSDVAADLGDITLHLVTDLDETIEKKVDSLLLLMTIDEKIAQTAEVLVNIISTNDLKTNMYGSVFNGGGCPFSSNTKESWVSNLDAMHDAAAQTRLGIPILYGIDAVHGNATVEGATVFPHNIGMGCTGDTALVAKMANITAREMRALGINLNFAPAISVVRDERWGRSYEGYGETPEINSLMAAAYVRGLQGYGDLSRPDAVAACAKHFIGDGGTTGGVNGGVTELTEATMRAVHLPPYQAAIGEGLASIMPSYNAWKREGVEIRCTTDKFSLTDMLKTGLNWNGFCLSDWDAIPQALASTDPSYFYFDNNVEASINAGIDMAMIAMEYSATDQTGQQKKVRDYVAALKRVQSSTVPLTRLDDAVKRILRVKFRLNLFAGAKSNASLRAEFGSAAHRAVARECVQKSLVLLKNEANALPLQATDKVVVVGPWASKIGAQCGGWTITWQGDVNHSGIAGTTILDGLKEVGGAANVTYDQTGENLSSATKIVLVIGETPYAETGGDHGHTNTTGDCPGCSQYPGGKMSINFSDLPNSALLQKCVDSNKPVIVILISGRPLIVTDAVEKSSAFVAAWLPGSEGGGVADVLYNKAPFAGKLRHTWPKTFDQVPINSGTDHADEKHGVGGEPLFEYGYGLTY